MKNKKIFSVVSLILAVIMILSVIVPLFFYGAVGGNTVNSLQKEADALAAEKKKIESELKNLKVEKANQMERKNKLDSQIRVTEREIDTMGELIEQISNQIAEKEKEIAIAEQNVQTQYEDLKVRIRANYESGQTSYLDVLLSSESFSDILVKLDIVQNILEYDQKQLEGLREAKAELEKAKAEAEAIKAQRETKKSELEQAKSGLQKNYDASVALVKEIEENTVEYKEEYEKIEKEEEKVQKEIKALLAASKGVYVGGTFTWPAPGYYTITSSYGMRLHPVLKVKKLHTGVDIGAPRNAKIVAANTGTVIKSTYSAAYGNYVVIDHGGGVATLYAHMTKQAVSKGDKVTKGDTIGYVGSTGYSTGPHLHFEVIRNGQTENPMQHFSKK